VLVNSSAQEAEMTKHRRECLAICRSAGLSIIGLEMGGRHMRVVCAQGSLSCPCTPSDRRWRKNFAAQARRLAR